MPNNRSDGSRPPTYETRLAREFIGSPWSRVPTPRDQWEQKMVFVARLEVRAYCHLFREEEPDEWATVAGVLRLSTDNPDQMDDEDLATVYRNIADDYKVWTIEGSPYLDWERDAPFAEAFCRRWNRGDLL